VKYFTAALLILFLAVSLVTSPAANPQATSGKDVVAATAYVSYEPVARGQSFQAAVVMKLRPGFHVNAREVTFDYLIPTDLRAEVPAGFKVGDVIYPKGKLETFAFAKDKPLNVYSDTATLLLPLTVLPNAPLGPQHLTMKLRYQACSTEICLPPVTKDVDATINVVADRSAAKPAHSEVFNSK
jgi:hypothetical protein